MPPARADASRATRRSRRRSFTITASGVPHFAVFPRRRRVQRPRGLQFPLIVKSLTEEASAGISQASIVYDDEKLRERVAFVHENVGTDALVEEFIEGRELYVCVLGNKALTVLPDLGARLREHAARRLRDRDRAREAQLRVSAEARDLPAARRGSAGKAARSRSCTRASGSTGSSTSTATPALDFRLTPDGEFYFLEANPNPEIASTEEFASAAEAAGIEYPELLQKIVNLGLQRARSVSV